MKEQSTKNSKSKNTNSNYSVKKKSNKKKSKRKRRLSQRGFTSIVVMILILIAILIIIISSSGSINNVTKITNKLSSCVGSMSIEEVKKSTRVNFYQSASNELLSSISKFNYVAENTTTTRVCGTKLPKWVAYAKTNKSGIVTQISIYNFTIISDSILGTNVDDYIVTSDFIYSNEEILDSIEIQPYITILNEDGSKRKIFRYYYRDNNSKNDVSVQITMDIDVNNNIINIYECNLNFINGAISFVEPPESNSN